MTETAVATTTTPTPPVIPTELNVDIIIDPASTYEPVIVQVGQTFTVQPPFTAEWNVEYHQEYLFALTPAETSHNPDPPG